MSGAQPRVAAGRTLGPLLSRVERHVARRLEAALGPDGPSLDQWRVLHVLADGAGRPMSEIAAATLVPAPTLTKIVDRLVDSALVHRRPDDVDRRRVLVFVTDHGRATHDRLAPALTGAELAIADELGAEADRFLALLARLSDRLG